MKEMNSIVQKTGGFCVIQEMFKGQVFQDSIRKYFEKDENDYLRVTSGSSIEVIPSKPIKIKGCLGNCHSMKTKTANCSKNDLIGESETDKWYLGGTDPNSCYTFFFEVDEKSTKDPKKYAFFQFLTTYKHPRGSIRLRVTTICKPYFHSFDKDRVLAGIDQSAIVTAYAKYTTYKRLETDSTVVIRWLDKVLI